MKKKIIKQNKNLDSDNSNDYIDDRVSFYMNEDNVETYKEALKGYDGSWLIKKLTEQLDRGKDILELGMGTGLDYESMTESYNVLGTDNSPVFIKQYKSKNPASNVMILDARDISLNRKFDCIYSNKVLHHLTKEDFIKSLSEQYDALNGDGIVFMTLWHGKYNVELLFDDTFRITYYEVKDIENIVLGKFNIIKIELYTEIDENDSMLVVLKKK